VISHRNGNLTCTAAENENLAYSGVFVQSKYTQNCATAIEEARKKKRRSNVSYHNDKLILIIFASVCDRYL